MAQCAIFIFAAYAGKVVKCTILIVLFGYTADSMRGLRIGSGGGSGASVCLYVGSVFMWWFCLFLKR